MLEVVRGHYRSQTLANLLADKLIAGAVSGTLYLGYPVLALLDEPITIDALLLSPQRGIFVFLLSQEGAMPTTDAEWQSLKDDQDRIALALQTSFTQHKELRKGRTLAFTLPVLTVFPTQPTPPEAYADILTCTLDSLTHYVTTHGTELSGAQWAALNAAIEKITTIKPRKRRIDVTKADSKGAIIKSIEAEIANLDRWQKGAAIECPDGPQRIRGLAGSGKTVVLALKAAYLHALHPDWNIAITFYSRALHQQLRDLIHRFTIEHTRNEPDWERLHVLHAWGGRGRPGMYTMLAEHAGVVTRDWTYAKGMYGMSGAFAGICNELLDSISVGDPDPLFDAILIDEAQDLPSSFFRLIQSYAKPPKRIVWAYDELQNLSEADMPTTAELFGKNADGTPVVSIENKEGEAKRDIVLPVCYRNTPWALTLAHALGFGIYRKSGLVQHFDDPQLWLDVGYERVDGALTPGQSVSLRRKANSSPKYFSDLLDPADAVTHRAFSTNEEQLAWVAAQIKSNLTTDELEHDDILVILANPLTAKKRAPALMRELESKGIPSHLVGETSSNDELFIPKSVAVTQIYRAKGNEAPMVYILDAGDCVGGYEQIKLRNILFTAITRSRAWLRICGPGFEMVTLSKEIEQVLAREYRLEFPIPTVADLKVMRRVHRDLTSADKRRIREAEHAVEQLLNSIESGDVDLEHLPQELRERLQQLLRADDEGED